MILQNKVVVISGIGPGLGSKLALLAAQEGAKLVVAARSSDKLDSLVHDAQALGINEKNILKIPTDITDSAACARLADKAVSTFGQIDVLINSAYDPGSFAPVDQANLEQWQRPLEVNYFGTLKLTQAVVPHMRSAGGGSIVMINTMAVHKPMQFNGGYAASKAALASASAHLALELGKDNIRVNSVYMGWMWGPSVENYMRETALERGVDIDVLKQEVIAQIPLGCIPSDEECGRAALFLASDYASAVTGANLDVNGGEFMPH